MQVTLIHDNGTSHLQMEQVTYRSAVGRGADSLMM